MHSRFSAGWRFALWTAVIVSVIVLPFSTATADRPDEFLNKANGAAAVEDTRNGDDHQGYARVNYLWPYNVGPFYGEVDKSAIRAPGVVRTAVGSFNLAQGELNIPAELRKANLLDQVGAQYFVIALDPQSGVTGAQLRDVIASNGGAVMRSMPVASLLARMTPAAMSAVQSYGGVVAIEPYHPALKLHPDIGRVPLHDAEQAVSDVYDLRVRLFEGENAETVAQALAQMGGNVVAVNPREVRVEIHRSKLAQVAGLEPVQMVFENQKITPQYEENTTTVMTGRWRNGATPYHDAGVDGSGGGIDGTSAQVLMVLDSGIQLDGGELSDSAVDAGTAGGGHRKVLRYEPTALNHSGGGDLLGCDGISGWTHGQVVSASALGNATNVAPTYGTPWFAVAEFDKSVWKLDGVAPGAMLVAFDGMQTNTANCNASDLGDGILVGVVYLGTPGTGSLGDAYTNNDARISNFSWGTDNNAYDTYPIQVDEFLDDQRDAMVFIAVGNGGLDADDNAIPDEGTMGSPATAKNAIAVGECGTATDTVVPAYYGPSERRFQSAMGPAPGNRIAPLIMAPGAEATAPPGSTQMGLNSAYGCTSGDNGQTNPVACDIVSNLGTGGATSVSSGVAAGAGALIRDYFAQGFYPDGTSANAGNAADQVPNISGALMKAMLISSAEMLGDCVDGQAPIGRQISWCHRFNPEQGYGRIELDNSLPLNTWALSTPGLIVADGGIDDGANNISGLDGLLNVTLGQEDTGTFELCDPGSVNNPQTVRVALAWTEESGEFLVNDLDLELQSPDPDGGGPLQPVIYKGNYFTDDNNRDRVLGAGEDCPAPGEDAGDPGYVANLDARGWTLPTCVNTIIDTENPTEAIFLTSDYFEDGEFDIDPDDDNQLIPGTWTIKVKSTVNPAGDTAQRYAVVIAGGVCLGSSVRWNSGEYACNNQAAITVNEVAEAGDMTMTSDDVESRTTVEVVAHNVCDDGLTPCVDSGDCGGGTCNAELVVDSEPGSTLSFTQVNPDALQFLAENVIITDGTAFDPGNGALDVRGGYELRVTYADVDSSGSPDPDRRRISSATMNCDTNVTAGDVVFAQLGRDTPYFIDGGCERNARDQFEFGYPDRYMDGGELLSYNFAFASREDVDLDNVELALRCVIPDTDSPATCPGTATPSAACPDPKRLNNPTCDGAGADTHYMEILDSPRILGLVLSAAAPVVKFSIQMDDVIAGTPEVELILDVISATAGKTTSGTLVNRHTLDVDEASTLFSTDFPTGGTEFLDFNNNEVIENPTTNLGFFELDYQFETRVWSDMTQTGKNLTLESPWNFDTGRSGFYVQHNSNSEYDKSVDTIAFWGEDINGNNELDGLCVDPGPPSVVTGVECTSDDECIILVGTGATCDFTELEDRDPVNGQLDWSWGTAGGCGWQTRAPGTCTVPKDLPCYTDDDCLGVCDTAAPGGGGIWHTGNIGPRSAGACVDACQLYEVLSGSTGQKAYREHLLTPVMEKVLGADYTIEITWWGWNEAIDLADINVGKSWELDTDVDKLEPVDLLRDTNYFGHLGAYGSISVGNNPGLTNGYSIFAPVKGTCAVSGGDCFLLQDCTLKCQDGLKDCTDDTDCESVPGIPVCDTCTGAFDANGTLGGNRDAANSCFFLGDSGISTTNFKIVGTTRPPDDDCDNELVCSHNAAVKCGLQLVAEAVNQQACEDDVCNHCVGGGTPGAWCATDAGCAGGTCDTTATCSAGGDGQVDEYVFLYGPERNMSLDAWNGPDMRFGTLEDIYGDTGDRFQAAVGMLAYESEDTTTPEVSYGIGVDDMVVEWREYELVKEDPGQTCANGECATVDLQVDEFYQGSSILTITVLEKSPPPANDCDWDGTPDGTTDCDSDGTDDLVVRASPEQVNPDEEIVACNLVSGFEYKADIPVSISYDSPGVVFIRPIGVDVATVNVLYFDTDDGTGQICKNAVDPLAHGFVEGTTSVLIDRSNVVLVSSVLDEVIGDGDGWADTNETVRMAVQLGNRTDFAIQGVTARLLTNDDKIACITNASIDVGDIPAGANQWSYDQSNGWFEFIVGDVQRSGYCADGTTVCTGHAECVGIGSEKCDAAVQPFSAAFSVLIGGDTFEAATAPQTVILDLDLDGVGGDGPTDFYEGFEPPYEIIDSQPHKFNQFTTMHLDFGLLAGDPWVNSQGWRCQYSDPDWRNSNSYGGGSTDCYVGPTQPGVDAYYWQVQDGDATFGPEKVGKAYADRYSMYMGYWHTGGPDGGQWTTPTGGIEAIVTREPINVGFKKTCEATPQFCDTDDDCPGLDTCTPVAPELSFKHQVSIVDTRNLNTSWFQTAGGGVIQVKVADIDGNPVGDWIKLQPYQNVYDQQEYHNYFSCYFDPIDDGNTEDDYFDPTDPNRRYGPASLCYPEFIWARMGETDLPFGAANLGYADGPGLPGSRPTDPTKQGGTWVETVFNMQRYRGQRFFMRFLQGQMKFGENDTYQDIVGFNLQDDGWWIDDIILTDTLTAAAEVVADIKANSSNCGILCNTVTAAMTTDPVGVLSAPGQVVELDASGSLADRCVDGTLQYQYCVDANGNKVCEPAEVIRGWTDNPTIVLAPTASTNYLVDVRCATAPSCHAVATKRVQVFCPSTGNLGLGIADATKVGDNVMVLNGTYNYHYCEGVDDNDAGPGDPGYDRDDLAAYLCSFSNHPAAASGSSYIMQLPEPAATHFNWVLFREEGTKDDPALRPCNDPGITWGQCQSSPTRDAVLP